MTHKKTCGHFNLALHFIKDYIKKVVQRVESGRLRDNPHDASTETTVIRYAKPTEPDLSVQQLICNKTWDYFEFGVNQIDDIVRRTCRAH